MTESNGSSSLTEADTVAGEAGNRPDISVDHANATGADRSDGADVEDGDAPVAHGVFLRPDRGLRMPKRERSTLNGRVTASR